MQCLTALKEKLVDLIKLATESFVNIAMATPRRRAAVTMTLHCQDLVQSEICFVLFCFWRKQDLLKNEEEPERDNSEQNVPEGERGR
jgi:hypothetical protein